jgi:hypothetical protein
MVEQRAGGRRCACEDDLGHGLATPTAVARPAARPVSAKAVRDLQPLQLGHSPNSARQVDGAGSAHLLLVGGPPLTVLALVAIALAPSLAVLAGGTTLAAFRVARERGTSPRPARRAGDGPDSPSMAA